LSSWSTVTKRNVEKVPINFVDIETNWPWTGRHRIVEIWIGKYRHGVLQSELPKELRLVNPECSISERAINLHGITEKFVRDCPTFGEISNRLVRFIGEDVIVAHNGARFDFPVIRNELRRCRHPIPRMRMLDTVLIGRRLLGFKNNKLDHLARIMRLPISERHRAKPDGVLVASVFYKMIGRIRRREGLRILTVGQLLDSCL
jgi:DNA polymerase-3 subunit epsilon